MAIALLAGAAVVVRARTGPATTDPMVPIARMAGARMLRRMRMTASMRLPRSTAQTLDPAARTVRHCPCLFIHQSLADFSCRIDRNVWNIQIVKPASLFAMAIFTSIAVNESEKISQFDAGKVALQVAAHITKQLSTHDDANQE